jgi:hypothetical protein
MLLVFVCRRAKKTEGAIKNGQSRENRRDNQEKTEGAIKNGQSREIGKIGYTRHKTKTNKTKTNTT